MNRPKLATAFILAVVFISIMTIWEITNVQLVEARAASPLP
jgi:hypothetical protein